MSQFSEGLKAVLDDTELFTREAWASVLGIPETSITSWLKDETLPTAERLRMLLDVFTVKGIPDEAPVHAFRALLERPSLEITPLGDLMGPSIAEYLKNSTLFDEYRRLRNLPDAEKTRRAKMLNAGCLMALAPA